VENASRSPPNTQQPREDEPVIESYADTIKSSKHKTENDEDGGKGREYSALDDKVSSIGIVVPCVWTAGRNRLHAWLEERGK
jgi:hypothetical protein